MDGHGGDLFYFTVVTAGWLADNPPPKGFEFARALLVTRWDYETVRRAISDLSLHTEGRDWSEVATKLSRHARWEFEDQPGAESDRVGGGAEPGQQR